MFCWLPLLILLFSGVELRDTPNDIELFHSTMNKISLALVGESTAKAAAPSAESKGKHSISPPLHQG